MDKKFEAVIDLEAQPFNDAVRSAIAGLQALAAELDKANSQLNTMAGGAANSAAAADTVAASSAGAATALGQEAEAAKAAAGAHEKHADAAKKNAAATAQAAAENKKMREGLMVASAGLRMASSVANTAGNRDLGDVLSVGGSVLNMFAMKAMMGNVGLAIAGLEAAANATDKFMSRRNEKQELARAEKVGEIGAAYAGENDKERVSSAKSYADLLREQLNISKELRQVGQEIALLDAGWTGSASDVGKQAFLDKREESLMNAQFSAQTRLRMLRGSENTKSMADFDAIRKQAIGEKTFELDLINAKKEEEKVAVIENRIKQLQAEGESKLAAARSAKVAADPAEIKRLLDEATALLGKADALEIQKAGMGENKKLKDVPGLDYEAPQVDALMRRGIVLGGSIGSAAPTTDYARRSATATEKVAMNTERMLAKLDQNTTTATWGG